MALHAPPETKGAAAGSDQLPHDRPNFPNILTTGPTLVAGDCTSSWVEQQSADWRPVPGYVGFYEAARSGVIRSLDREIETADGRTVRLRGVVLTPVVDRRNGTHGVTLSRAGRLDTRRVGALVLAAFGEPAPRPWAVVIHLDGDRSNCALQNLRWGRMGGVAA